MTTTPLIPCCPNCGSTEISADAAARWSVDLQDWEVTNVFDKGKTCDKCEDEFSECDWRDATAEEIGPETAPEIPTSAIMLDQPLYARVMGKAIRVVALVTGAGQARIDRANELMAEFPGMSLLHDDTEYMAYMAAKDDLGVPPTNMEPFRT